MVPRNVDSDPSSQGFRIGDWQVFPKLNRISRNQDTVHLEPRLMELLVYFSHHPGKVLSKNDIIDTVWNQQIVANSALSKSLALLRRAIGDDARRPTYIETIHKRGYRLIAEIEGLESIEEVADEVATGNFVRVGEREIVLHEGENTIGRMPEATVCIDSPKISRCHARIVVDESTATLEDAGSKNGTFLAGKKLTEPEILAGGDEIFVGSIMVKFFVAGEDAANETVSDH